MNRALLPLLLFAACGPSELEAPPAPQQQQQQPEQPPPAPQQQELTGLPCDVRAALQTACAGCHSGAVYITRFRTRADLLQLAPRVAERLSSTTAPMPPSGARQMTEAERALIGQWVAAGMPAGECGGLQ